MLMCISASIKVVTSQGPCAVSQIAALEALVTRRALVFPTREHPVQQLSTSQARGSQTPWTLGGSSETLALWEAPNSETRG